MSDHYNVQTGEVYFKGEKYYLTKTEIKIFDRLNKKDGIVTFEELYESMYGIKPDILRESERKMIRTNISRISSKIKPLIIINRVGFGYELKRKVSTNE